MSFVSTWSPPALEQIFVLDRIITNDLFPGSLIINQETISKTRVFQKKGNYNTDLIVDRDGELVDDYYLSSLPMHYFLDRRGVIKKIVTGVLNEEELKTFLEEISAGVN